MVAGLQTQPAILSFTTKQMGNDLPNIACATVYSTAMIEENPPQTAPTGGSRVGQRTAYESNLSQSDLQPSPQTCGARVSLPGLWVSGASRCGRGGQYPQSPHKRRCGEDPPAANCEVSSPGSTGEA